MIKKIARLRPGMQKKITTTRGFYGIGHYWYLGTSNPLGFFQPAGSGHKNEHAAEEHPTSPVTSSGKGCRSP